MNDTYVYFALKGDNFDPNIVTQAIGIQPTKIHRKGDPIGNSGNKIKFSGWYLYTEKRDNILVDKLVDDLVTKLFDKITIINDLKRLYQLESILELVVYIDCNDEISTPAIGHDSKTIEFLYKTRTETDVDMYKFNSGDTN